jgi:hypothetical protein
MTETMPAIEFSNVSTKATVDDVKTNGFGVWAYIKNDVADNVLIMENTKVTYNSATSSWGYSPLKYWNKQEGSHSLLNLYRNLHLTYLVKCQH